MIKTVYNYHKIKPLNYSSMASHFCRTSHESFIIYVWVV